MPSVNINFYYCCSSGTSSIYGPCLETMLRVVSSRATLMGSASQVAGFSAPMAPWTSRSASMMTTNLLRQRMGALGHAEGAHMRSRSQMCKRQMCSKPPTSFASKSEAKKAAEAAKANGGATAEAPKKQTFADMMRRHGPVFLVTWGAAWALSGLAVYTAIEINGPQTAIELAQKIHLDKVISLDKMSPTMGNVALALGLNEALELIRFPLVAAITPSITKLVEGRSGAGSMQRKPGKFTTLMKEHGAFFLVYWTGFWAITGVGCYAAISALGSDAAFKAIRAVGLDNIIPLDSLDPSMGNLAVAVAINEGLEIVRLPFIIATLPWLKRVLKRK